MKAEESVKPAYDLIETCLGAVNVLKGLLNNREKLVKALNDTDQTIDDLVKAARISKPAKKILAKSKSKTKIKTRRARNRNGELTLAQRIAKVMPIDREVTNREVVGMLKKDGWQTSSRYPDSVVRITLNSRRDLFKKKRSATGQTTYTRR